MNISLRWALALLLWVAANLAMAAAIVGIIDIAFDQSITGRALLVRGLVVMGVTATLSLLVRPRAPREIHRLAMILVGLWPFTLFFFFIIWRSGVAEEQRVACAAGDTRACYRLGERSDRRGKPELAREVYQTGCTFDDGECCVMAGSLRERGRGGPVDLTAAVNSYEAGCEIGHGLSCWRLGQLAVRMELDADVAQRAWRRGCEAGNANACARVQSGSP
jgi:TPR repeat protein